MKKRDPLDHLKPEPPKQPGAIETFTLNTLKEELSSVSLKLAKSQDEAERLKGRLDLMERYSKDERHHWGTLLVSMQEKNAALMVENATAKIDVAASKYRAEANAAWAWQHEDAAVLDAFRVELMDKSRAEAVEECQRLRAELATYKEPHSERVCNTEVE